MKLNRQWLWSQLRANIVAISSMAVALTGLAYNTYRNEKTEINHTVRARDAQSATGPTSKNP